MASKGPFQPKAFYDSMISLRLLSFGGSKTQKVQARASIWKDKSMEFTSTFNHSLQRGREEAHKCKGKQDGSSLVCILSLVPQGNVTNSQ